jgi:hypothetical protein
MSHWHTGFEDGQAIERGEKLNHNPEHVNDPGYRDGFVNGRAKAIAERVAAGGTEHMENEALEDVFTEKMGQIRALLTVHTNDGLIGQVADILTAAMNAAYRIDRQ